MGLLTIRYFLTKTIIFKQVKWQLLNKALIKLLYFTYSVIILLIGVRNSICLGQDETKNQAKKSQM